MKKKAIILAVNVLSLSFSIFAQTPGTLDLSFGSDGIVNISYTGQDVYALDIAFQSDGNMVVCGKMETSIWATRMDENGIINSSFGNNPGYFVHDFGLDSWGRNLCVLPDDKIIIAAEGQLDGEVFVMRLTPNGQLDLSFGDGNGYYYYPEINAIKDMKCVTTAGTSSLYIVGYEGVFGDWHPVMIKIDQDGNYDNSFGTNGVMLLDDTDGAFFGIDIDLSMDMIYATGESANEAMIVRCDQAGQIDPTFGTSGYVIFEEPGTGDKLRLKDCIVDQENHYITCFGYMNNPGGGSTSYDICALRINASGTMNMNFGVNGWSYMLIDGIDFIHDAVQQSDGKFYFAGQTEFYTSTQDFFLGRMGHFGFLDPAFGSSGVTNLDLGFHENAIDLLLDEDHGKLIVAGISFGGDNTTALVARYHTGFFVNSQENQNPHDIKVYPNPVTGSIHADIAHTGNSSVKFQLVNLLGVVVQSWNSIQLKAEKHPVELKLSNKLSPGTYILIAYPGDENEIMQQKVIVVEDLRVRD